MPDPGEAGEDGREPADDRDADADRQPAVSPESNGSPAPTDAEGAADRSWLRFAGLAAVVALSAGLAVGLYLLVSGQDESASAETVSMPNLVGKPETQAVSELRSQEIQYEIQRGPSSEQPNGFVYDQDPDGGMPITPKTDPVSLYISTGPTTESMTEVPDVRWRPRDDAVAALAAAKLEPDVHEVPSSGPPGTVTAQNPKPGDLVPEGTRVRINVSSGGGTSVKMPNVRGLTRTIAVATLRGVGLKPSVREMNSDAPRDTVIAQDPGPGEMVDEGTPVRVDVSAGRKQNGEQIAVPSVLNRPYEVALAQLQGAGFVVVRRGVDANRPAGIVIDQSPAGGETAPPGATVTLTVSKGPPPSAVPDVTSLDRDAAVSRLEDSGFKANVIRKDTDDPSLDGVVLSQDPAAGAQAKPGARVTIVVGEFAAHLETTAAAAGYARARAMLRERRQGT